MKVRWQDVKREIHDEVEKIWFDEPVEVTMSKLGVFPSGAGTDHQFLGNLFFLNADTQGMGWWTIEPAMYEVLADQDFSLDHCKKLFHYMNAPMAHLTPPFLRLSLQYWPILLWAFTMQEAGTWIYLK